MTREEVIEQLKIELSMWESDCKSYHKTKDALKMAIKALEQQPCEDTISRQAAIDATWFEPSYTDPLNVLTEVRDRLKALPSAQPERKKGQWIDHEIDKDFAKCSECGSCWEWGFVKNCNMSFCPNCGADMRGEQDG